MLTLKRKRKCWITFLTGDGNLSQSSNSGELSSGDSNRRGRGDGYFSTTEISETEGEDEEGIEDEENEDDEEDDEDDDDETENQEETTEQRNNTGILGLGEWYEGFSFTH